MSAFSNQLVVSAASFHLMRGHVEHGATVILRSGARLTLKREMSGWHLYDGSGVSAAGALDSAIDVTAAVVRLDEASA